MGIIRCLAVLLPLASWSGSLINPLLPHRGPFRPRRPPPMSAMSSSTSTRTDAAITIGTVPGIAIRTPTIAATIVGMSMSIEWVAAITIGRAPVNGWWSDTPPTAIGASIGTVPAVAITIGRATAAGTITAIQRTVIAASIVTGPIAAITTGRATAAGTITVIRPTATDAFTGTARVAATTIGRATAAGTITRTRRAVIAANPGIDTRSEIRRHEDLKTRREEDTKAT